MLNQFLEYIYMKSYCI